MRATWPEICPWLSGGGGGLRGVVSLADGWFGPAWNPQQDPAFFRQPEVGDFSANGRSNGAHPAPDVPYKTISTERAG